MNSKLFLYSCYEMSVKSSGSLWSKSLRECVHCALTRHQFVSLQQHSNSKCRQIITISITANGSFDKKEIKSSTTYSARFLSLFLRIFISRFISRFMPLYSKSNQVRILLFLYILFQQLFGFSRELNKKGTFYRTTLTQQQPGESHRNHNKTNEPAKEVIVMSIHFQIYGTKRKHLPFSQKKCNVIVIIIATKQNTYTVGRFL